MQDFGYEKGTELSLMPPEFNFNTRLNPVNSYNVLLETRQRSLHYVDVDFFYLLLYSTIIQPEDVITN